MKDFVHLHLHTEYSLLDGACRIKEVVAKAREMGQPALAITDHGVMYGVIDFYKECKAQGIKPIIGCEVYVAQRTRFDKVHRIDSNSYHLILLCENDLGYQNLMKLVSLAGIEGFYNKPRVDVELLERYSDGLIALSACLAGEIPRLLLSGDYESAKAKALQYHKIFKGNYYIEMQDHGIPEQRQILPQLVQLSKDTGIGLVATNDAHYVEKADSQMQHVLMCIQTNHTIDEEGGIEFSTDEFYLKSAEEMEALFPFAPESIDNTVKIAQRCNVEIEFGVTKLPYFNVEGGLSNEEYFRKMCFDGLHQNYGDSPRQDIIDRLNYEIDMIARMGYVDYYLIVHDFIRYAKEQGIPVGPGRGSGAGSLAAYCVGITGVDPIRFNLLFERFLNPERVSMPDFDIDFCYERRQEVIDYVVAKYGSDHVAQIITFGTMAARAAVRDVGRVLGVPYATVDAIAKMIPMELHMTIQRALAVSKELKSQYDSDDSARRLIDLARQIEGMPRHASTHAAGVVITRDEVSSYVPLQKNDESIVTEYTMTTLEELGLLKMDFLGLRNLTIINDCCRMIRENEPGFDIDKVPFDDKALFEMLSAGQSSGVFQFESPGMKQVLSSLKPENIEDLIAVISLYRPGPMESIGTYIENRHNPGRVRYKHKLLEPILKVTYGCIVYQEQVMEICRQLAGFSLGKADLVRRAMSKKKASIMEQERQNFVTGCAQNGIDKAMANEIFDDMSSFASYAFNKSHAAAYACVSYQTAYLKCHYTKEYMASLLTSILDNTDKVIEYIAECKNQNITVLPPDINHSGNGFLVEGDNIRFGLLAVKNLGRKLIADILAIRETGGEYTSFFDFCKRVHSCDINKRAMESLIRCGALDCLGLGRRTMLQNFETVLSSIDSESKANVEGQMDFFGAAKQKSDNDYVFVNAEEFSKEELLRMEKETTGLYLSGHPLEQFAAMYQRINAQQLGTIIGESQENTHYDNKPIRILGIVAGKKIKVTKSGSTMAFLTVEDLTAAAEVIVFPTVLSQYASLIQEGSIVVIDGRVSIREEEQPKIICEKITAAADILSGTDIMNNKPESEKKLGLYLQITHREDEGLKKANAILQFFSGSMPVYVYFQNEKKLTLAPKNMWITPSEILIRELKNILGEGNVVLRR